MNFFISTNEADNGKFSHQCGGAKYIKNSWNKESTVNVGQLDLCN
jgi:hypothetical protein